MKSACLLPALLLSLALRAQEKTPYNPGGDYHTWSIKGHNYLYPFGNGGGVS